MAQFDGRQMSTERGALLLRMVDRKIGLLKHVMVCVLAYALWKTPDHLAKQTGLETEIRKPDRRRPNASPKSRPMTPEIILRQLRDIQIGDILLETTDGRTLALRRVARPKPEQARILAALKLSIPERLTPDREM